MLFNRLSPFFLGALFSSVLIALAIWIKSGDSLHSATHEWEDGDGCAALENLYAARPIMQKRTSHLLASIYATGECVQQDITKAETFLAENGLTSPLQVGERLFYLAETKLMLHPDGLQNQFIKNQVLALLNRSKNLGFRADSKIRFDVSEENRKFLLSVF